MKAAFYTRQGAASDVLRLGDQPAPSPAPGDVRVRLRSSGVNPSDWKTRSGGANRPMLAPLVIPHSDGAGEIDMVGPGVPENRVGERVWIWNGQWKRAFGTAAEYIVLPAAQAVRLPDDVDYAAGACLGIPALTAMQAIRLAEAAPGMTLLVSGGAGAVGHYAIQFAKARGARVLTTVSSEAKAAHARIACADEIINYRTENVGEQVRALTDGHGVDAMIEVDLAANGSLLPHILHPHGRVIVYGTGAAEAALPVLWLMQNSAMLRLFLVYELEPADRTAGIAELETLLRAGKLTHAIGRRLPLGEIVAAHEMVEQGQIIGNVVLDIP